MIHKRQPPRFLFLFCLSALLFTSKSAGAIQQERGLWGELSYTNYLSKNKRWVYLLQSEIRFLDTPHIKHTYPLHALLETGGVGYELTPSLTAWTGFGQKIISPYHRSYGRGRLWQQLYWKAVANDKIGINIRTRLDENKYTNVSHTFVILRQYLEVVSGKYHYKQIYPTFYNEVFVPLNYKHNVLHSYEMQNRLFTGVTIDSSSHKSYWKIGYMNQYFYNTMRHGDVMNHALLISFVFGVPSIIRPVSE